METEINRKLLQELSSHTRSLGFSRFMRGMGYERHGELPFIVSYLQPNFRDKLNYLDIGSGDSVFPSYILKNSCWDITCVDKFSSVQKQHAYAKRVMNGADYRQRLHIMEQDFIKCELPAESFDIITNISVIEHFEGDSDAVGMEKSAKLLKTGGLYLLTTLINDGCYREFYVNDTVYGASYDKKPLFYQRHYDLESLEKRVLQPSGLKEVCRLYQGEYGFEFGKNFMNLGWPLKMFKVLYQWASPSFAGKFLTYRDYPVSSPDMPLTTYSCVLVVLTRE